MAGFDENETQIICLLIGQLNRIFILAIAISLFGYWMGDSERSTNVRGMKCLKLPRYFFSSKRCFEHWPMKKKREKKKNFYLKNISYK